MPASTVSRWDIEIVRLVSQVPDEATKREIYEMIARRLGVPLVPGDAPPVAPQAYPDLSR